MKIFAYLRVIGQLIRWVIREDKPIVAPAAVNSASPSERKSAPNIRNAPTISAPPQQPIFSEIDIAFCKAIRLGERNQAMELLQQGANIDTTAIKQKGEVGKIGWAAIHWAAAEDDVELIQWLVAQGASINLLTAHIAAMTPLQVAITHRARNAVACLLELGAQQITTGTMAEPLSLAAGIGDVAILRQLLAAGADATVGSPILSAVLPSSSAIPKPHGELLEILLAAGARVDLPRSRSGWSARMYLDYYRPQSTLLPLLQGHPQSCLADAAIDNDLPAMRSFLEAGADVNEQTEFGMTPLFWAIYAGKPEAVKLLVEAGANLTQRAFHKTVLEAAAERNRVEIFQFLHQQGSPLGQSLRVAAQSGSVEIIGWLLGREEKIEALPLRAAVEANQVAAARLLLEAGADVEDAIAGSTLLMLAAQHDHLEMTQLLIEFGANVNGCDQNGFSVLHYATHDAMELEELKTALRGAETMLDLHLSETDLESPTVQILLAAGANFGSEISAQKQQEPSIIHTIYVDGKIHAQLLDVEQYDTATAYKGCLRNLQSLHDLADTTPLEIISWGTTYRIADRTDFCNWVAQIFERDKPFGFANRLQKEGTMYKKVIDNLRTAYTQKVDERSQQKMHPWKLELREHFLQLLQAAKLQTLLEIGCGAGQDSLYFQQQGLTVTSMDLTPAMVEHCKAQGLNALVADFASLSAHFPADHFDAIYAMNCLLHVPHADFGQILQSIRTVLRPGGLFYLGQYGGETVEGILGSDHYEPKRFFARYDNQKIQQIAAQYFDIVEFKSIEFEGEGKWNFQRLILQRGE